MIVKYPSPRAALLLLAALLMPSPAPAAQKRAQAKPSAPSAVAIPEPFRRSVSMETQGGMRVVDARETENDRGRYLAVVYRYPEDAQGLAGQNALNLYLLPAGGGTVKSTNLYDAQTILLGMPSDPRTAFLDLNRDGVTEMVATAANGRSCRSCQRVLVFALDGMDIAWHAAQPMTDIRDLDGDGVYELLVEEARWESYWGFSRAGAADGTLVYTFRFGGFVFAGPDFPDFYRGEIERLEAALPAAVKAIDPADPKSDEAYIRTALSIFLAYNYAGQAARGREALARMLGEHAAGEEMARRRQEVLADFLSGESAAKLKAPSRGKQLPRASR